LSDTSLFSDTDLRNSKLQECLKNSNTFSKKYLDGFDGATLSVQTNRQLPETYTKELQKVHYDTGAMDL